MKVLFWILCACVLLSGCGITTAGLKSNPGYAPMSYPKMWEAEKQVGISLGPFAMKVAFSLSDEEDREELQILKKIRGLRVNIYDVSDNEDALTKHMLTSVDRMKAAGWVQTVSVNEQHERVMVMVKFNDDAIAGFTVLTLDQQEAVFVNIIGNLDPKFFDQVMGNVGGKSSAEHAVL